MSDPAPAAAPAPVTANAPPAGGAPAAPEPIHAAGSFQDFQQRVQDRARAQQQAKQGQPPPVPKTVQPQPKEQPLVQPPAESQGDEPPPDEIEQQTKTLNTDAEPEQPQTEGAMSPEDAQLFAKFKELMSSEVLADELLAKKLVALKNGDEIEYEPFEEVKNGRMRQRDYTREMQKFDQERQQWEQRETFYKQHFDAIFSDENDGAAGGDAMYEIYTRQGKRKQLLALGKKLAMEEQADIDAANGMGYAVMQRMRIQDPRDHRVQEAIKQEWDRRQQEREGSARARALEFENQRLRQAQEQKQQQGVDAEYAATQRKQLEQLRPRAFEALGLNHEDPLHRDTFDQYFAAIFRQERATKVTPEIVMKAVRAAKEAIGDARKARANGGPGGTPQQKTFQPQLGAGGGKVPNAKPKQWDPESFAEHFKLRSW